MTLLRILITTLIFWTGTTVLARPNILVVISQTAPAGDTPQLDRLANAGMSLDKFYLSPDRATTSASLLTGRYHYRTGVANSRAGESTMHGHEITVAEALRASGYATQFVGEWSHGSNWPQNAEGQGFDVHFEAISERSPRLSDAATLTWVVLENYSDAALGNLIDEFENDVVIFIGAPTDKFYGGIGSVHEGGIRVPCFVKWKGVIPSESHFRKMTSLVDLLPTVLDLAGVKDARLHSQDGISFGPILRTGGEIRPDMRWPNRVFCTSWTPEGFDTKKASVAVRTDRWLAVRDPDWRRAKLADERHGWELYDLLSDPLQRYDVADEFPYLLGELKADFIFWMDHTTDDGLGPVPIEIGYPKKPVVKLEPNADGEWALEVVSVGKYRVEATNDTISIDGKHVEPSNVVELTKRGVTLLQISPPPENVILLIKID